jgi:hypothetical protein
MPLITDKPIYGPAPVRKKAKKRPEAHKLQPGHKPILIINGRETVISDSSAYLLDMLSDVKD